MFRGLVSKLWTAIFIMVTLILLIFTLILSDRLEQVYFSHEINLMKEHNQQWAKIISNEADKSEIQKKIEMFGSTTHYVLTVLDKNQEILFSSSMNHLPLGQKANWIELDKRNFNKTQIFSGYNQLYGMDMITVFSPSTLKNGKPILLVISTSKHELADMNRVTKNILYFLLFAFFLISALMALIFSHWLSKPLIATKNAALEIVHGNFDHQLNLQRRDELGDLGDAIDNLAVRLKRTISSLHNTNRELNEVLTQWKDFLADVSHELRTPLFLISGYTEAIMDQVVDDKTAKQEYLPVIHKETLRLQKLVNDLTKVEKSETVNKKEVALFDLLAETLRPFSIVLKDKNLRLVLNKEIKKLGPINLDPDKFGEVIFNLVDNAIRHTPEGGTIALNGCVTLDNKLKLEITDTGIGIPPEHLPSLFDRFYRVDKSRSRSQGGSGLGLAIVKKIIELHDGTIGVESSLTTGTTFSIIIPVK